MWADLLFWICCMQDYNRNYYMGEEEARPLMPVASHGYAGEYVHRGDPAYEAYPPQPTAYGRPAPITPRGQSQLRGQAPYEEYDSYEEDSSRGGAGYQRR